MTPLTRPDGRIRNCHVANERLTWKDSTLQTEPRKRYLDFLLIRGESRGNLSGR